MKRVDFDPVGQEKSYNYGHPGDEVADGNSFRMETNLVNAALDGPVAPLIVVEFLKEKNQMNISDWLDERAAENVDVSQITLPADMAYDEVPDETIFFKEINPCGLLCSESHPFSTVERFGHWYCSRGQDKKAGIHSAEMHWRLFTKDKNVALNTAKAHIE